MLKLSLFIAMVFSATTSYASGITLGGTRLIYNADKREASISLSNSTPDRPFLIQSWVSEFNKSANSSRVPFVLTPPVFKLQPNKNTTVRVVNIAGSGTSLPTDRESVYLLNVRAIPAVNKENPAGRLTISTQNIIKLIYRPVRLTSHEAGAAGEKLVVTPGKNQVLFHNPTPYVVTLTRLSINGKQIDRPGLIMPFSDKNIAVTESKVRHIAFSIINDFGGISSARHLTF